MTADQFKRIQAILDVTNGDLVVVLGVTRQAVARYRRLGVKNGPIPRIMLRCLRERRLAFDLVETQRRTIDAQIEDAARRADFFPDTIGGQKPDRLDREF